MANKTNKKKLGVDNRFESIAVKFTSWIGSPSSIIAHTIFFILCFLTTLFGLALDTMLLFLTTVVSLEAIYLAILIQFTVNKASQELTNVGLDIDEIQEDVDEMQEDVGEIQKDIDEIQEDVDEMQEDVGEIQKDIDEIQEDVDDIEEGETLEEKRDKDMKATIERIQSALELLMKEVNSIKTKKE